MKRKTNKKVSQELNEKMVIKEETSKQEIGSDLSRNFQQPHKTLLYHQEKKQVG